MLHINTAAEQKWSWEAIPIHGDLTNPSVSSFWKNHAVLNLCDQFTALSIAQQPAVFQESFKAQYFFYTPERSKNRYIYTRVREMQLLGYSDLPQYTQSQNTALQLERGSSRAKAYP